MSTASNLSFKALRPAAALSCMGLAALVLCGWVFGVKPLETFLPGLTTMKANAALGFLAASGAVLLIQRRAAVSGGIATAAAMLGLLTIGEYVSGHPFGIDEFLFADPDTTSMPYPGRMSPATAMALAFLGGGVVILSLARNRLSLYVGHAAAIVPLSVGYLSLVGYAYGVERLYNFGPYVSVALPTSLCCVALGTSLTLTRAMESWGDRFVGHPIATQALVRLLTLAILVPFATGLLIVVGARLQLYRPMYAPALFALLAAIGFAVFAATSALKVRQAEDALLTTGREKVSISRAFDESEARNSILIESLPQLVWTCLPDGRCNFLSRQWLDYTGRPPITDLDIEWLKDIHPDDRSATERAWIEANRRGEPYEVDYRLRRHDGVYRWFKARGIFFPGRGATGDYWFGTSTDIDDIVAAREVMMRSQADLERLVLAKTDELRVVEATLRQSQKMEAVGQLTGGLAHDFNNLLTGVTGSLDLMQVRIRQGRVNDVERYVTAAQGAAQRAAALTHRLLAFSRRQTLDPKPTDLNRLVSGMHDLVQRTVGPGIAVERVAAGGLWTTLVDPGQMENALLNLCINARDAMPDGGKITVETANTWLDARAAQERELPPGQYVTLSVSDTGTGMSPDVIVRAFDPFFTTKPIGQGTGLGLSMIYGFARQSGGQVRIYSEVGDGSTIRIYLPRDVGVVDAEDVRTPSLAIPRAQQGETVLVVDDEPTVRMLVTEVLEDLGYTAIEAADGPSGLKVLQSDMRIDLLVTDVGLPGGMNGRQLADAARVARPDLKVLFITGYAENAVLNHGHLDAGMHVVTKPFAIEALASRIKDLIDG